MEGAKPFEAKPRYCVVVGKRLSNSSIYAMRRFIAVTILAIGLIFGCVQGALWQFDRYQVRHTNNDVIRTNTTLTSIDEANLMTLPQSKSAWRVIELQGSSIPEKQILIRNRYHEGKYGFGVLTLFESTLSKRYWVDRGWVKAGDTALARPITPTTPSGELQIIGRLRLDTSLPSGSFFALPKNGNLIASWNLQSEIKKIGRAHV